ncbi:MAG: ATP-binding protein, partial [Microbacteriaceae bacterium]|nr:ATP-binding protein [Microbacteriaceae bacterium]
MGRDDELHALRVLVTNACNGVGGALLVQGDPGVGKTTLLAQAVAESIGVRVLRITGYEVESALAFAALQQLGRALGRFVDELPAKQRDAVRVAAGLADGRPPEQALIGLATLSLLARAGEDEPVLLVVDDAQHLDTESLAALGFVARRLSAESVALAFAARDDEAVENALAGVPRLRLGGLGAAAGSALVDAVTGGLLDPSVVADLVRELDGN